ncbi:MAG: KilA-N domain-containing protein [Candidatus Moraniibacteriota bacterium]
MKKKQKIIVGGLDVVVFKQKNEDYISLTDIAKHKNSEAGLVISHWLSTRFAIEFMGIWERMNNPNFKVTEFSNFKNQSGANGFVLSVQQWVNKTNAIGIFATRGRYNSGTFAHKDIAFEFASWISAEFKFYLIREFQRLKEDENDRQKLGWNLQRTLAKINYRIHTDAIKEKLIPHELTKDQANMKYANEADLLNVALFGITAKMWRDQNPKLKGNIRDYAPIEQLVVLSNLESINALLIRDGLSQKDRILKLNNTAIIQMKSLLINDGIRKLESPK